MSQYYGDSQWPSAPGPHAQNNNNNSNNNSNNNNNNNWDHQTPPPPPRSSTSSVNPREEAGAFSHQLEEVDRAVDNLVKSGKMFGGSGRHSRAVSGHGGPRSHSSHSDFGDRGQSGHHGPNLQNFYASQRHQSSRGSNEAEQMMQAKRRMAAQRERELRNYHQEQQYNRNNSVEYNGKTDRTLSPGNMSEDDRRDLIARQRSALYGEGAFVDENGTSRPNGPGFSSGPSSHRGPSPLAFDYSRGTGSVTADSDSHRQNRADSNASPQSNPPSNLGVFDNAGGPQATRTSNSSPTGGSPTHGAPTGKPAQAGGAVAPIGTRPSGNPQASNPALGKRSTTPSPLSQGYSAGEADAKDSAKGSAAANPSGATGEGYTRWGGNRSGVWGNKSNLGVQASVWG